MRKRFYAVSTDLLPYDGDHTKVRRVQTVVEAPSCAQAKDKFLSGTRLLNPGFGIGLSGVTELNWPTLNSIAAAVLAEKVGCSPPPVAQEIVRAAELQEEVP